jgi:hypothetical protein
VVNIDTSTTIDKMTSTMVSTSQTTYTSATNVQTAKIIIDKGGVVNGDAKINQKIDVNLQVQAQITQELVQNLQSEILNELNAKLDQSAQAKSTFGGLAGQSQASRTVNVAKVKNALKVVVTDEVTVETIQKIQTDTFNAQIGEINIRGVVNGDVIIDQNTIVRITVINILDNVINLTNKFLSENKAKVQVKQKAKSESGMSQEQTIGLIISCIMSFLCCMLLVFMLPKIIDSGAGAKKGG